MKVGLCLVWSFFCALLACMGQEKVSFSEFQIIGQEQGLPIDQEHAFLFEDSRGFLWISSLGALYRYDGTLVKPYLPDSARQDWLRQGYIQHRLLEDKQGRIWITIGKDIFYYHPRKERFFKLSSGEKHKEYRLLHINPDGKLWGLKGKRLFFRKNGKTGFPANGSFSDRVARYASQTDDRGFLKRVIATPVIDPGFEILDLLTEKEALNRSFLTGSEQGAFSILAGRVLADKDTLIWLCSQGKLVAFNPLAPGALHAYAPEGPGDADVHLAVHLDQDHMIVGTRTSGIWVFNKKSRKFEQQLNKSGKHAGDGQNMSFIESALADRKGTHLWVSFNNLGLGTASGYSPQLTRQERFNPIPLGNAKFASKDISGGVWFIRSDEAVHLQGDGTATSLKLPEGLQISSVWTFFTDIQGRPWLQAGGEIFYIPANSRSWKKVPLLEKREALKAISPLPDGRIFVFTDSLAFYLRETAPGVFKRSEPLLGMEQEEGDKVVFSLPDGYLAVQNLTSYSIQIFQNTGQGWQRIARLSSIPFVQSAVWDQARKSIWFGTTDGLRRVSLNPIQTDSYFHGDEWLDHAEIKGLLIDDLHRLWLAGPDVLAMYIPEGDSVRIFRQEELGAGPFMAKAAVTTSDGRFFFGARDGVISFDPEQLKPYPYAPKPYIYAIQINGVPWDSLNPAELTTLGLKYSHRNIRLTLSAIGFYLPQYIRIQYRLKGYDQDWQAIKPGEHLNYNLTWGKGQIFQMRAIGPNGQQSPVRELQISVAPPFWLTWWFVLVSIAALAGVVALIVNYFVQKRLKEETQRQKLIEAEWGRMMNDLHDGIGFDLTAIRAMSERASRNIQDTEIREQFERIYRRALDGMQSMGEIFRVTEDQSAGLEVFVEFLRIRSKEYLDSMGLEQVFKRPEALPDAQIGAEQRQNIWLVLKESLNNTSKHAQATLVRIEIWEENRTLFLRIQDNGCGFDPSIPRSGRGSRNMPKRMHSIGGSYALESSSTGTTISLSCPLRMTLRSQKFWKRFKIPWRPIFFPDH